jgi:hypothetical protein
MSTYNLISSRRMNYCSQGVHVRYFGRCGSALLDHTVLRSPSQSLRIPACLPSNDDPLPNKEAAPLVALQTGCRGLLP